MNLNLVPLYFHILYAVIHLILLITKLHRDPINYLKGRNFRRKTWKLQGELRTRFEEHIWRLLYFICRKQIPTLTKLQQWILVVHRRGTQQQRWATELNSSSTHVIDTHAIKIVFFIKVFLKLDTSRLEMCFIMYFRKCVSWYFHINY